MRGVIKTEDIVNLFVNNGVAVAVIFYFMYRDYRFQETLQKTLQTLVDTVDALKETLEKESTENGIS